MHRDSDRLRFQGRGRRYRQRGDKSAQFGIVISGVEVVEAGVLVVVVTSVADGVGISQLHICGCLTINGTVAPYLLLLYCPVGCLSSQGRFSYLFLVSFTLSQKRACKKCRLANLIMKIYQVFFVCFFKIKFFTFTTVANP